MMIKQVTDFVDTRTGEDLCSRETHFTMDDVANKEIGKMVKYELTNTFKEINDFIVVISTWDYEDGTALQIGITLIKKKKREG